jgi:hypothetical protein
MNRTPWEPNLSIYKNDQSPKFENTLKVIGSIKNQIICILETFKHSQISRPCSPEQLTLIKKSLRFLSRELNILKESVKNVQSLQNCRL